MRGLAKYCFNLLQMVEVVAGEMFRYRCDTFDASFSVDSVLAPLPLVERLQKREICLPQRAEQL